MKMTQSRGFSMLEVLVTLIIIMLGILGLAGMQMLAINSTQIAKTRSLAAILASSLTAEMQANVGYWGSSAADTDVKGDGSIDFTKTSLPGNSTLNAFSDNCQSTSCTAAKMAAYDMKKWGVSLATLLPSGTGNVSCNGAVPVVCTIAVQWKEKNVALHNPKGDEAGALASGTSQSQSYKTLVTLN